MGALLYGERKACGRITSKLNGKSVLDTFEGDRRKMLMNGSKLPG
jgi:hypothetical protein